MISDKLNIYNQLLLCTHALRIIIIIIDINYKFMEQYYSLSMYNVLYALQYCRVCFAVYLTCTINDVVGAHCYTFDT